MAEWADALKLVAFCSLVGFAAWIFMRVETEKEKTKREWNKRLIDYMSGIDERPDE